MHNNVLAHLFDAHPEGLTVDELNHAIRPERVDDILQALGKLEAEKAVAPEHIDPPREARATRYYYLPILPIEHVFVPLEERSMFDFAFREKQGLEDLLKHLVKCTGAFGAEKYIEPLVKEFRQSATYSKRKIQDVERLMEQKKMKQ